LTKSKPYIVLGVGSAGSGKTLLGTSVGVSKLQNNEVRKLVITRPAISVSENIGLLPGTLQDKMAPWIRPVYDVLLMHYPKGILDKMIRDDVIEICPLGYMRGRDFSHTYIICDEAQNTTPNQMLMLLTRIGTNSKLVITGDPQQYDLGFENNGLIDLMAKINYHGVTGWVEMVEFNDEDIERNPIIHHILNLYY
jgi:phosphate starvation-inducible PhoH-like protein